MNKPVFVISCAIDTYSGYGARARDLVKAIIETDKYDVKILPQKWGNCAWGFIKENPEWSFLEPLILKQQLNFQPDIWMQHTIPNEFQPVGKYNIGVTAGIEATLCKPEWLEGLNRMDMNWVSSKFSKTVFEKSTFEKTHPQTKQPIGTVKLEKPVEVVFEGANLDLYKHLTRSEIKNINLDEIKESFCYLFVGHWMQGEFGDDRKNVGLTIKAFFETFKNYRGPKPALILKASIGVASYTSRDEILRRIRSIRETVNSKNLPNVYLLNGEFSDEDMNELYNNPKVKAMVSLTKGEGYGRPLLEFSLTGKPIIATNWSGHTDFLKQSFTTLLGGSLEDVHKSAQNQWLIKEAKWFKVNDGEVGRGFKEVFKKYKQFLHKSKQQKHYSKSNFSYSKMKDLIDSILDANIPEFPKQMPLKMPELKLPNLQ